MGMTGMEVDHAENGRIAVEKLLDAEPGYYDLVFMDIQMPVMNGYESASAIRCRPPRARASTIRRLRRVPIWAKFPSWR